MKNKKQFLYVILCFCLIIGMLFPSKGSIGNNEYSSCINEFGESIENPPFMHITEVKDGRGLFVTIENIGNTVAHDITLCIETTGGMFIWIPNQQYHLESIPAYSSEIIHISLFGLGLGKLTVYPQIMLSVSSTNSIPVNKTLTTQIIGPYCTVLGEFFNTPRAYQGYTLFSPEYSTYTFLMENDAEIVHEWKSNYIQGLPVYLDEQGNLIRACSRLNNPVFLSGGFTGRVEIRDWNDTLQWEFDYSDDSVCLHHDIEPLPNGNILMIAWEYKTTQEAINAGRDPGKLPNNAVWPDHIIEVKPIGSSDAEIVWEWHVWDHLIQDFDPSKNNYGVVRDHPERIDINYGGNQADWTHINSVDYHPFYDQIILSIHNFNEIWIIDHSTTTEEAAGHTGGRYGKGGDLLYRWGNPQTYRRGGKQDQQLFGQHDAQWIEQGCPGAGNILIFNNGVGRPDGFYSSIDELHPPVTIDGEYLLEQGGAYGPDKLVWRYVDKPANAFFSGHISGAQRLPNGNTLICSGGEGIFFEVTQEKYKVWIYVNTFPDVFDNHVFKIRKYSLDYPGVRFLVN